MVLTVCLAEFILLLYPLDSNSNQGVGLYFSESQDRK